MKKSIFSTDKTQIIDELLTRSIFQILPSKEALKKELLSGRRLRIYIGADATGPSLHIGHATNFILLEKLRALGHEVIVLFGDFTAMIGDPSGKESAREPLSSEQINKNLKTWKKQITPILSFSDKKNPAKIFKNSAWLKKLSFEQVLKLASSFTVGHMLERDMFEKRMKEGRPVYVHEFFYPLMQGYDSVAMNVDVEIGGSDQIFNMLAGRVLQRKYNNKEKFVIATTLLENPKTGKKLMSKSEGNYIGLSDKPFEMYGKTMALPDAVVTQVFVDSTLVSLEEINRMRRPLEGGGNPKEVKMRLAFELVSLYHGKKAAEAAQKKFIATFQKRDFPDDAPALTVSRGAVLKDILISSGIASSRSEATRLIRNGAVKNSEMNSRLTDENMALEESLNLKIGKRRFLKVHIKN